MVERLSTAPVGAEGVTRRVRAFVANLTRATKNARVHGLGSAARIGLVEACERPLRELLASSGTLALGVRAGALSHDSGLVLVDEERGPSHALAAAGAREIRFFEGIRTLELDRTIGLLGDEIVGRAGEDLPTTLWRLDVAHVRVSSFDPVEAHPELARELAARIAALVARDADDRPTSAEASAESRARLEHAAALFARRSSAAERASLAAQCGRAERLGLLVELALERCARARTAARDHALLARALDAMIEGRELVEAERLLLAARAVDAELARTLGAVELPRALEAVESPGGPRLLAAIGEDALPAVSARLHEAERAEERAALTTALLELTSGAPESLMRFAELAPAEVAMQLLHECEARTATELASVIAALVGHPSANVRALAVRLAGGFVGAVPEQLVARALSDSDPLVRTAAARAAAARPSDAARRAVAAQLERDELLARDPAELRALLAARSALGGESAALELGRLLGSAAGLGSSARPAVIEAIANALAASGSPAAREALAAGARSLNPRLRAPAKAALASLDRARGLDAMLASFTHGAVETSRGAWPAEIAMDRVVPRRFSLTPGRTSVAPRHRSAPPPAPASSRSSSAPPEVRASSAPPAPESAPATAPPRPSPAPSPSGGWFVPGVPTGAAARPAHTPRASAAPSSGPAVAMDDALKSFVESDDER